MRPGDHVVFCWAPACGVCPSCAERHAVCDRLDRTTYRLIGSVYGSRRPTDDIARLVDWFRQGRLKLRELVGRTYTLNQINAAFSALASSEGARGVILQ